MAMKVSARLSLGLTLGLLPAACLFAILILSREALAAKPEYEILCRSKAKETAADIYKSCVDDHRSSQIESLKKEYQDRLKAIKDDYEKELSSIAGRDINLGSSAKEKSNSKQAGLKEAKAAPGKKSAKASKASPANKKVGKKKAVTTERINLDPPTPTDYENQSDHSNNRYEDTVAGQRAYPMNEVDESVMDIPEPIPVYVPEEQVPIEVY